MASDAIDRLIRLGSGGKGISAFGATVHEGTSSMKAGQVAEKGWWVRWSSRKAFTWTRVVGPPCHFQVMM